MLADLLEKLQSYVVKPLVGLDIGTSGVKAVELAGQGTPRLLAYNRVPLPWDTFTAEGEIQEQAVIVTAIKKLFETKIFSTQRVAVGLSGNAVMTKKISIPKMAPSELHHQLYWEAEQYIPFNIAEVALDFAVLGNTPQAQTSEQPMIDVLLVAAKRDYIATITGIVKQAGLSPEVIDNQAFALGNSFEFNYGETPEAGGKTATNVIIDFGAGSTKVTVVERDKTTFTRELRHSGIACTKLLAERLGIPVPAAEKMKLFEPDSQSVREIVREFCHGLVEEIARTLDFYASQSQGQSLTGIYTCGGASRTPGLMETMESKLAAPIRALNPVQNIAGSGKKMNAEAIKDLSYVGAVAVGLSLRRSGDSR